MKNKRVLTLLLLLVIVFALCIGYALNTKTLQINGTATASATDENFKVRFKKTGDNYDAPTNLVNATGSVTSDIEATMNVTGLTKKGDTAQATYTVENVSENIDASIVAAIEGLQNQEYFKVTTSGITDTATTISTNGETTVTVNVELLKTPIADQEENLTIKLTATPVVANN